MPQARPLPAELPRAQALAEALLGQTWGGEVRLCNPQELRRHKTYRYEVAEADLMSGMPHPETVIVKMARLSKRHPYNPDSREWNPAWRFLGEWASTEFLSILPTETEHNPSFIAANREEGVLVMEDFGRGETLWDALRGRDSAYAEQALIRHAEAVGRLHADTIGQQPLYNRIRDALGPRVILRDDQAWCDLRARWEPLNMGFQKIGVVPAIGFEREYRELIRAIENPDFFFAFTHCDPCPGNCLIIGEHLRFIDFERSGYHHCLLDAVYARMCFPTCGYVYRVPSRLLPRIEGAYRAQLGRVVPQALDDKIFGRAVVHACAYWLISNKNWLLSTAMDDDWNWGTATWRQRVATRLKRFVLACREFNEFPAMAQTARRCVERLQEIWPPRAMHIPYFPAFMPKGLPE